ncbi:hypothetical protein LTR09_008293 [Extremus antarcticus]|uniref:Uncharacterized protein n=1 Tax=Extremus antarcticus TaxID=702011 RepID=A0AAJ0DAN2_9PEZI|nr:hypothetical protein LTR09_008293 [Extremus antarcticus]
MDSQGSYAFANNVNDYNMLFNSMVNDNMLADSMFSNNGFINDPFNDYMIGSYMTDDVVNFVDQSLEILNGTVDRPIVIDDDEVKGTTSAEEVTFENTAISVNEVTDASPTDSAIDLTSDEPAPVVQPEPTRHKGTPLFTPYQQGPVLEVVDQITRAIGKRKRKDWEGEKQQYVPSAQASRPKKRKANQVDEAAEPAAKRPRGSAASPAVEQAGGRAEVPAVAAPERVERKVAARARNQRQKAVATAEAARRVAAAPKPVSNWPEECRMLPMSAQKQADMAASALECYKRCGLVLPGLDPQVQRSPAAQSTETVRADSAVSLPAEEATATTTGGVVAAPTDEQVENDDSDMDSLFGDVNSLFDEADKEMEEAAAMALAADKEMKDIDAMMLLVEEERKEDAAEKLAAEKKKRERQVAAEKEEKKRQTKARNLQRQRERRAEVKAKKLAAEREEEEQVLAAKRQAEEEARVLAAKQQADEEERRLEEIRQREIDEYESDEDEDEALPKLVKMAQAPLMEEAPQQEQHQEHHQVRQEENDDDSEDESEYSDDEEDDEHAVDAMDEDAMARAVERQQQLEEVAGLEQDIASKRRNLDAQTNQLLKKTGSVQLLKMEEALQAKRREYGLAEGDSEDKMEGVE